MILFDSFVKISLFYLILSNLDNRFLRVFDPIYRISPRKPVLLSIHKTLTGMTKTIKWLDLPQYESAYKINVVIKVNNIWIICNVVTFDESKNVNRCECSIWYYMVHNITYLKPVLRFIDRKIPPHFSKNPASGPPVQDTSRHKLAVIKVLTTETV